MEREIQVSEEGEMAKPETLGLIPSAQVSTAGSEVRMPWTVPDSPRAFSLPQECLVVVLGHLIHCSQILRTVGKTGQQNEYETP